MFKTIKSMEKSQYLNETKVSLIICFWFVYNNSKIEFFHIYYKHVLSS